MHTYLPNNMEEASRHQEDSLVEKITDALIRMNQSDAAGQNAFVSATRSKESDASKPQSKKRMADGSIKADRRQEGSELDTVLEQRGTTRNPEVAQLQRETETAQHSMAGEELRRVSLGSRAGTETRGTDQKRASFLDWETPDLR